MSVAHSRVSFAELCLWPDDGRRYELYDGEVIVVPSPYLRHQRVASHVESLLLEYELQNGGLTVRAPFDIVLTEYDVIQPDIVFFRADRQHLIRRWEAARVAPDLAVEVLSRSLSDETAAGRKICLPGSVSRSTGSSIQSRTVSRSISFETAAT